MKEEYSASADGAEQSTWESKANLENIAVSVPDSFGGVGEGLTPEHLYASSLLNCYLATLRVIARKSNFDIEEVEADISVKLDTESETPLESAEIEVRGRPDSKKMKMVAKKAKQNCYIHQSVNTDMSIVLNGNRL